MSFGLILAEIRANEEWELRHALKTLSEVSLSAVDSGAVWCQSANLLDGRVMRVFVTVGDCVVCGTVGQ
jgi:hypothetical protein